MIQTVGNEEKLKIDTSNLCETIDTIMLKPDLAILQIAPGCLYTVY